MTSDIIIIGAGPGGYETAVEAAREGLTVTVVERDALGGTCLNRGCIPTKALLRSAEVLDIVGQAEEFGIKTNDISVDYARAAERKDAIVNQLRDGVTSLLSAPGINVVKGEAEIVSAREVIVDGAVYTAEKAIIIATGSCPASLPIDGADLAVNSDHLLTMTSLPSSAVIIGGGVIGMEFAGILNSFGTEVTVVEYCPEILPPFDRDIAKRLRTALSRRGVTIIVSAAVKSIAATADGHREVTYERKGKSLSVEAEMVVMAVGRRPVVPKGAENAGVAIERGRIVVSDDMSTSVPGIYAIGDVNGRCMLAHTATAQGRVALASILGHECAINLNVVPSAVFTCPETAMVGLTEEAAIQAGLDIAVGRSMFRANGKALALGETDGLVKIIVNKADRRIVGCHIIGPHASDIITEVALAIAANLTADDLADAIHSHPTLSEVIPAALAALR